MFATLSPINDITDIDIKSEIYDFERPKRKRQRLDHLSQEEKLMRRKLKNRMAAQSARDRKKVKMQDLEIEVTAMSKEKNELLNENKALRLKNALLERQNEELLQRLSQLSEKQSIKAQEVSESSKWCETLESAELIRDPQQKEQVSHPLRRSLTTSAQPLTMLFVFWVLIRNLTLFSMYFTCIPKNCWTQKALRVKTQKNAMAMNANICQLRTTHHSWNQLKT